ncbi:MAG TPA: ABC transporter permease [Smithella sp.]|nr:ABC transporter permease [Smithella sp.]HPN87233.1 ABC transporter permease [Smithella sp.]
MISIFSTLRIALRALWVKKMRSALTMLGIIIGVSAVIIMLAVGTGVSRKISSQISSIGSNLIIIMPGSTTQGGVRMGGGSQSTLTTGDAEAILRECSAVAAVAPMQFGTAQVVFGNQNWSTGIQGTTPGILEVKDCGLSAGRNMSDQDIRSATKVCLLGQTVVDNLFGSMDPLGQVIRIRKIPFTVIGVLESKGQSLGGQDQDDTIIVPLSTAQKKLFGRTIPGMVRSIMVKARSSEELSVAERQITDLLRQRHRIGPNREDDFTVMNLTQVLEMAEQTANTFALLLGAIASVSLVVGGIGIMNIMLVSVTERTREIGIRMAVGAKTWDIRIQFIVEALTLSMIGGITGIIIGGTASFILSNVFEIPSVVSLPSVLLAFCFSGLVGIFFGFYPAYKASLLNPIDALRFE